MPQLITGCGEARIAAVENVDGTRIHDTPDVLAGYTDGKIIESVDVEVTTDQHRTEGIARAGDAYHRRAILVPQLIAGCGKARDAAVKNVDSARVGDAADILAWHTECEVLEPIVVEVAPRRGKGVGRRDVHPGNRQCGQKWEDKSNPRERATVTLSGIYKKLKLPPNSYFV